MEGGGKKERGSFVSRIYLSCLRFQQQRLVEPELLGARRPGAKWIHSSQVWSASICDTGRLSNRVSQKNKKNKNKKKKEKNIKKKKSKKMKKKRNTHLKK